MAALALVVTILRMSRNLDDMEGPRPGRGRRTSAFHALSLAAFAPTPRVGVAIVASENTGRFTQDGAVLVLYSQPAATAEPYPGHRGSQADDLKED